MLSKLFRHIKPYMYISKTIHLLLFILQNGLHGVGHSETDAQKQRTTLYSMQLNHNLVAMLQPRVPPENAAQ